VSGYRRYVYESILVRHRHLGTVFEQFPGNVGLSRLAVRNSIVCRDLDGVSYGKVQRKVLYVAGIILEL